MKMLLWGLALYVGYKIWKDKQFTFVTPEINGERVNVAFQLYSGLANNSVVVSPDASIVVQSWPGGYTQ